MLYSKSYYGDDNKIHIVRITNSIEELEKLIASKYRYNIVSVCDIFLLRKTLVDSEHRIETCSICKELVDRGIPKSIDSELEYCKSRRVLDKRHEKEIAYLNWGQALLQKNCPHNNTHYNEDPAGGNGSWTMCLDCGAEV